MTSVTNSPDENARDAARWCVDHPQEPENDRFDGERSREEIEAEKALKPRPDLIPVRALRGGGMVGAYGRRKHGNCTWRVAGTEQATIECHAASAFRHLIDFLLDPNAVEEGSGMPVLYHLFFQVAIMIDLQENPP